MSVKEVFNNGTACFVCPSCHAEFCGPYEVSDDTFIAETLKNMYESFTCPACVKSAEEEKDKLMKAGKRAELEYSLNERMEKTGIPKRFRSLEKPYVRHSAEWLWTNRGNSVLVSGETGTGKTSSVGFIVRLMMKSRYMSVRYYTRQTLFADYVRAKTTDGDNESRFLKRIGDLDLLIIDEMVGKKGDSKLSDSAQELFFNLVDGVYSEERDTKVWILGNFYKGAIEGLVDDPKPLKRRLVDSFKFAWFDDNGVDETVSIGL